MITTHEKRDIISSGIDNQKGFSIKATGKSFRILISNLYSDKISSVQRELSQNAWDSHIAANNLIPFKVWLPSQYEPNYIIRDFGTGIPHSYMMDEYTQIFHSSKDKTNEYTGAFGVGRCSALSICDSYICESFIKGVKNTYSVHVNEDGVPCVSHFGEEKTDEPDGFLVNIPVDPSVAYEFKTKAVEVYRHYKVKPSIENYTIDFPKNDYLIISESGEWGLLGNSSYSFAIMGQYSYPIEISSITEISDIQRAVLNSGFICHFNTGELEVQASREALHYSKATIQSIKDKIDAAIPEIKKSITQRFDNKNTWEKMGLYHELFDCSGKLYPIYSISRQIKDELNVPNYLELENFKVTKFYMKRGRRYSSGMKLRKAEMERLVYSPNTEFMLADTLKYLSLRMEARLAGDNNSSCIIFVPLNDSAVNDFNTKYGIDLSSATKISSLPYTKPIRLSSGTSQIGTVWIFNEEGRSDKDRWEDSGLTLDKLDNIVYVVKRGYQIDSKYGCHDLYNFESRISSLNRLLDNEITVYGLTETQLKKVKNKTDFLDFEKAARENYLKDNDEKISNYNALRENYSEMPFILSEIDVDGGVFAEVMGEYKNLRKNCIMSPAMNHCKATKCEYNLNILYKNYPLLALVDSRCNMSERNVYKKEIKEYILWKNKV